MAPPYLPSSTGHCTANENSIGFSAIHSASSWKPSVRIRFAGRSSSASAEGGAAAGRLVGGGGTAPGAPDGGGGAPVDAAAVAGGADATGIFGTESRPAAPPGGSIPGGIMPGNIMPGGMDPGGGGGAPPGGGGGIPGHTEWHARGCSQRGPRACESRPCPSGSSSRFHGGGVHAGNRRCGRRPAQDATVAAAAVLATVDAAG
mmetsp:Transcript_29455/g.77204  ORF Transcript_29455/g.77204 Transcript_29455/m.77204 type:complete len:203 (+) Transcript_29455:1524-2132(+)